MNKLLVLIVLLISIQVRADILFIDMNNSASEVAVARAEARRRGVDLVIVPQRGSRASVKVQLEEALNDRFLSGPQFSSLIVSGHYGDGKFYGENFGATQSLTYSELATVFRDPMNAPLREGIDSLLLWGCYTARPRAISDWQGLFPGAEMIAGFNFAAPSAQTIASPRMMRNVLRMSYEEINNRRLISRVDDFINMTEGREDFYDLFSMTNSVVVAHGCYISSKTGYISVDRLEECPPSMIDRLIKRKRRSYDPFLNANSSSREMRERARSHGESGLYRFMIDSKRYANCFRASSLLPDPSEVDRLCRQFDCN